MGICASCFGRSQDDESIKQTQTESTPLLQDPALVLAPPQRHEPNQEEQLREQAFLNRVVQHAAESLVDIKAFAQGHESTSTQDQRADKAKQFEAILDRLLAEQPTAHGDAGDAEYVDSPVRVPASSSQASEWSLRPVEPIIVPLAKTEA